MLTPKHLSEPTTRSATSEPMEEESQERVRTHSPLQFYRTFRGSKSGTPVMETDKAIYTLFRAGSPYADWVRLPGDEEVLCVMHSPRLTDAFRAVRSATEKQSMTLPGVPLLCSGQALLTSSTQAPALHLASMLAWCHSTGLQVFADRLPQTLIDAAEAEHDVAHHEIDENVQLLLASTALRCGGKPEEYALFLQECAIADPENGVTEGLAKLEALTMDSTRYPLADGAHIPFPTADDELRIFANRLETKHAQQLRTRLNEIADSLCANPTYTPPDLGRFTGFECIPMAIADHDGFGRPVLERVEPASPGVACYRVVGTLPNGTKEVIRECGTAEAARLAVEQLTQRAAAPASDRAAAARDHVKEVLAAQLEGASDLYAPATITKFLKGIAVSTWEEMGWGLESWKNAYAKACGVGANTSLVIGTVERSGSAEPIAGFQAAAARALKGTLQQHNPGLLTAFREAVEAERLPQSPIAARRQQAAVQRKASLRGEGISR